MGLLEAVILAVLGGGTIAAVLTFLVARKKAPAEVDSIIVNGAESAVLSIQKALEASAAQCRDIAADRDRLLREIERKDRRIEALERQLDRAQATIDEVRAELHRIRNGE